MENVTIKLEIVDSDKLTKILALTKTDTMVRDFLDEHSIEALTTHDFYTIDEKYRVGDVIKDNDIVRGYTASFIDAFSTRYDVGYYAIKSSFSHAPVNRREQRIMSKLPNSDQAEVTTPKKVIKKHKTNLQKDLEARKLVKNVNESKEKHVIKEEKKGIECKKNMEKSVKKQKTSLTHAPANKKEQEIVTDLFGSNNVEPAVNKETNAKNHKVDTQKLDAVNAEVKENFENAKPVITEEMKVSEKTEKKHKTEMEKIDVVNDEAKENIENKKPMNTAVKNVSEHKKSAEKVERKKKAHNENNTSNFKKFNVKKEETENLFD